MHIDIIIYKITRVATGVTLPEKMYEAEMLEWTAWTAWMQASILLFLVTF
jgi:hypothetical protein